MPEAKVKTIEINYDLCGEGDPMDMITITRQQFREALAVCLAAFYRAAAALMKRSATFSRGCAGLSRLASSTSSSARTMTKTSKSYQTTTKYHQTIGGV